MTLKMKLKDIYETNKTLTHLGALIVIMVVVLLLWAWFGAPSDVNVPKAERYETNANIATQQAVTSETIANTIREQRIEAHTETIKSRTTLNQRKSHYEKTRNSIHNRPIADTDLDAREQRLRSDLEKLYPTPK